MNTVTETKKPTYSDLQNKIQELEMELTEARQELEDANTELSGASDEVIDLENENSDLYNLVIPGIDFNSLDSERFADEIGEFIKLKGGIKQAYLFIESQNNELRGY